MIHVNANILELARVSMNFNNCHIFGAKFLWLEAVLKLGN